MTIDQILERAEKAIDERERINNWEQNKFSVHYGYSEPQLSGYTDWVDKWQNEMETEMRVLGLFDPATPRAWLE